MEKVRPWCGQSSDRGRLKNRTEGFFSLLPIYQSIFFLAHSQPSQIGRLPYFHIWCGLSANLGCSSEMCCTQLAEIQDAKIAKNLPSTHRRTTLLGYIFATEAPIDNRKKNPLNRNVSLICPHNMVNLGPLAAEICWRVWGTPANFNGFRAFGSVTARHSSSGRQPNFAALNRGRHLYSARRPSRWALAHILIVTYLQFQMPIQVCCPCSASPVHAHFDHAHFRHSLTDNLVVFVIV